MSTLVSKKNMEQCCRRRKQYMQIEASQSSRQTSSKKFQLEETIIRQDEYGDRAEVLLYLYRLVDSLKNQL